MEYKRTPDDRFYNLPDYPFEPNYLQDLTAGTWWMNFMAVQCYVACLCANVGAAVAQSVRGQEWGLPSHTGGRTEVVNEYYPGPEMSWRG